MRHLLNGGLALALLAGCGASPAAPVVAVPVPRLTQPLAHAVAPATDTGWSSPLIPTLALVATPGLDYLSPFAAHDADADAQAQHPAFMARLAAASAETRLGVERLERTIAGDSLARAALMRLVLAGTLSATPRVGTGPTLLASLLAIATGESAQGLSRVQLLQEALDELAVPGRATQGVKATCEATSVQIMLARRDPAEYARLLVGLASPAGRVALANGEAIARVADWQSPTDGWRSLPGRLFQPAFAVYGNGPLGYSNTHDANAHGDSGLTNPQLARLCSAVFATPFVYLAPDNASEQERLAARQAAAAAGWDTPVWLDWLSGHVVLATGEQAGRESLDNPLGGTLHTVELAPLARVLHSVYVPASTVPARTAPRTGS